MAHLTLALLAHRLSEGAGNLLNCTRVYAQSFAGRMESGEGILDAFVIGCVVFSVVVMAAVNLFLRGSKWLSAAKSLIPSVGRTLSRQRKVSSVAVASDSVWVNSLLNWLYFHGDRVPELIPYVLRRLTDESARISEGSSIVFDDILPGSLPPKVLSVQAEADSAEILVIKVRAELTDVCIAIHVLQHGASADAGADTAAAAAYGGTWSLRELEMEIRLNLSYDGGVLLNANLIVPDVPALGAFSYDGKPAESCAPTPAWLDAHVRRLLASVSLAFRPDCHPIAVSDASTAQQQRTTSAAPAQQAHLQAVDRAAALLPPPQDARAGGGGARRLLLKVHKATGLASTLQSSAAEKCPLWCCTIELDRPLQVRQSAAVPMLLSPTWSEEFTLDLERNSKCLTFAVYDRTKAAFDGLPHRAFLVIDDIFTVPPPTQQVGKQSGEQSRLIELPLLMPKTSGVTNGKLVIEASFVTVPRSVGSDVLCGVAREVTGPPGMAAAESLLSDNVEARETGLIPQKQQDLLSEPAMTACREGRSCSAASEEDRAVLSPSSSPDQVAAVTKVRSDTEVLVVSPDMIVEVAKQKLSQQSKQPVVPGSRTTTIIVTSLHKAVQEAAGDVPGSSTAVSEPAVQARSGSISSSSSSSFSGSSIIASSEDTAAGRNAGVELAGSAKVNGKSKDRGQSYSPQKLEAKSEGQLKAETALDINGSHGESPVSSTSATDVRPKHGKLSGLRKFLSFRKKPKPNADGTLATPTKSKKH